MLKLLIFLLQLDIVSIVISGTIALAASVIVSCSNQHQCPLCGAPGGGAIGSNIAIICKCQLLPISISQQN